MKDELSILIPAYNTDCCPLVDELCRQRAILCEKGVAVELVVAEDGSTDASSLAANATIAHREGCRYIRHADNMGRAAIRNFLARKARYRWLLFLDCDMTIVSDQFLLNYVTSDFSDVAYGGYVVGDGERSCLRYIYEWQCHPQHTATERRKRPFMHFHTCNFMVRRDIIIAHPFDERFHHYGYEDVLWGKELRRVGIAVAHLDNPAGFCTYEDNASFVAKTEEGLRTLHHFRDDLRGYSQMISFAEGIHLPLVRAFIRLWHRLFGPLERHNLCGNRPSLRLFKLYKLGYYLTLH